MTVLTDTQAARLLERINRPSATPESDLAALRADANRYRWLRHRFLAVRAIGLGDACLDVLAQDGAPIGDDEDGKRLDQAIDSAGRMEAGYPSAAHRLEIEGLL